MFLHCFSFRPLEFLHNKAGGVLVRGPVGRVGKWLGWVGGTVVGDLLVSFFEAAPQRDAPALILEPFPLRRADGRLAEACFQAFRSALGWPSEGPWSAEGHPKKAFGGRCRDLGPFLYDTRPRGLTQNTQQL